MVIGTTEVVEAIDAVGADLILFTQVGSAMCGLGIGAEHVERAVGLVAGIALGEGAGAAAVTLVGRGGGLLAAG